MRLLHLENNFPKLASAGYDKTSEWTGRPPLPGAYNCIAFAADDRRCWWWPDPDAYWPPWSKSREETVACFVRTFKWLGYSPCVSSRLQFGYEKVALYAIHKSARETTLPTNWRGFDDWVPTHMARQLPDGAWTSKCGGNEDIAHFTLDALEQYGSLLCYGCPVVYMRRPTPVGYIVRFLQKLLWIFERIDT
jgi:hypothetical protein